MAFVTLTEARRSLAQRLGGYRLITSGVDDAVNGTYVGTPNGTDARRQIVSSDLVVLDVSGSGSPMAADRWKHAAAYIPSIPIQRQIAEKGYSGARLASEVTDQSSLTTTYVGMITLAEQFATALVPGLAVELHSVMPPIAREQGLGLHACINRALRAMVIRDRISVTKIEGAGRYSLAAYPWFERDDQLIGVSDSETLSAVDGPPLFQDGAIRFDAEVPYLLLNTPSSSTTFYIDVWRPRASWVRVGGTWQASTVGLVNETDAVSVDRDWLTYLAAYYAYEALANAWRADPAGAYWEQKRQEVASTCEKRLAQERSLDHPLPWAGHTESVRRFDTVGSSGLGWP